VGGDATQQALLLHSFAAGDTQHTAEEFGDLLFSLIGLARRLQLDAEGTLRAANQKFRRRFEAMEARARAQGRAFDTLSREELIALWHMVKQGEAHP
jgi:uncharacterized protein YabN with tetrapyrrole methylase and pyrophosphatase domain